MGVHTGEGNGGRETYWDLRKTQPNASRKCLLVGRYWERPTPAPSKCSDKRSHSRATPTGERKNQGPTLPRVTGEPEFEPWTSPYKVIPFQV